ncbi:MAG: hypothetical protein ACYDB1_11665 [Acidiferrobacteraceae bacterium]
MTRARCFGVTARWIFTLLARGLGRYNPSSLLDPSPLRALLERRLPFPGIDHAIAEGALRNEALVRVSRVTRSRLGLPPSTRF